MFYLNLLKLYSLWSGRRSLVMNVTVNKRLCEQLCIPTWNTKMNGKYFHSEKWEGFIVSETTL